MAQQVRIYALIRDGGDGSAHLVWFRNQELAEYLKESDDYCEDFGLNEGGYAEVLTLPENTDFKAIGITFSDDQYDLPAENE
jgi:hypothetical protein